MLISYSSVVVVFTFVSILAVVYMNGFTDAPNAIATTVGSNALSVRRACLLSCIMNVLGVISALIIPTSVANTIKQIICFSDDETVVVCGICAAMISVFVWAFLAWFFGIPTSESHSLLAALSGASLAAGNGFSTLHTSDWSGVIIGLLSSVIAGFVCALILSKLTEIYDDYLSEHKLNSLQIIFSAVLAALHGMQDGQKFLGLLMLMDSFAFEKTSDQSAIPVSYVIMCALFMGAGSLSGGKRIIQSVGFDMTPLTPFQGVISDLSAAFTLAVCTFFGMPVSTTHIKTMSVVGIGYASDKRAVNKKLLFDMLLTWILTFPGCGFLGYLLMRILISLF